MSHYGSSSGCLSSDHFDLFLKVYFIHGDYYPQVLGNSSCQWLAWSWLYVMEWIYILKCKLLVGLNLEIVVRRVVPLCWEWCPYMGRWERPFFVLPPFLSPVHFYMRVQREGIACKPDMPLPDWHLILELPKFYNDEKWMLFFEKTKTLCGNVL